MWGSEHKIMTFFCLAVYACYSHQELVAKAGHSQHLLKTDYLAKIQKTLL